MAETKWSRPLPVRELNKAAFNFRNPVFLIDAWEATRVGCLRVSLNCPTFCWGMPGLLAFLELAFSQSHDLPPRNPRGTASSSRATGSHTQSSSSTFSSSSLVNDGQSEERCGRESDGCATEVQHGEGRGASFPFNPRRLKVSRISLAKLSEQES